MIAHLKVVKGMELPPNACCVCGSNGTDDKEEQADAIFAPGVDVDWGGSWYLCMECADVIADLRGRATTEGFDKLQAKNEKLEGELDTLRTQVEEQQALIDKVREGAKAQKTLRKAA